MRPLKALRAFASAGLCACCAAAAASAWLSGLPERNLARALRALPDHDFTPDIAAFEKQGRISEALDWARYVTNNPALPGQSAATGLVARLEQEQNSLWRQADRAAKGFITGSGNSVEELSGAIMSDLVVYGDCRDLIVQGYYRLTRHETDPTVAALAAIGLLTEFIDGADWAPAVLKAFKKTGALSQRMIDWLTATCRTAFASRRLDPALTRLFANIRRLYDRLGIAKTAAVFRHAENADDVAFLAARVESHPNEVYRFLTVAGNDGLPLLRRFSDGPAAFERLALAVRKGPPGIALLQCGGAGPRLTRTVRYGERVIKAFRLEHPQRLFEQFARHHPAAHSALGTAAAFLAAAALVFLCVGVRHLTARDAMFY